MIEIDEFLLKSSIILLVFYVGYWFLLRKGTHFKYNRVFLLAGLVLSLLLPFLNFQMSGNNASELFVTLDSINISANGYLVDSKKEFVLLNFLQFFYFSIVLILFFKVFIQLYLLLKMFVQSETEIIGKTKVVITDKNNAIFSFFHLVFANRESRNSIDFNAILRHEHVHINQKHSVDILLAEVLTIVLWFNPFIWLYKKSIKENHEYLADEGVVNNDYSANHYQKLLFEHSTGLHLNLANNFNQSLTFKRLNMMKKIKSSKLAKYKVLIMAPVLILMIFFVACSKDKESLVESDNPHETEELVVVAYSETAKGKTNNKSGDDMYPRHLAYKIVDKMPLYPGGDLELRKFIATNIKYPKEAREAGISGKVFVKFVVTKEGKVDNVSIARGVHASLDNESVRVVKLLSDWKPGEQDSKKVNVWYTVPINFQLQ